MSIITCNICKKICQGKTNSHLISHFWIKTLKGSNGLSHEIKLERGHGVKARSSKRLEIEAMDYIFCERCEKSLAALETYVSNKFYYRIDEFIQGKNDNDFFEYEDAKGTLVKFSSKINSDIFKILIYSFIFRMEIFKRAKGDNVLEEYYYEKLRELLDNYCRFQGPGKLKRYRLKEIQNFTSAFILIKPKKPQEPGANLVVYNYKAKPMWLPLNEYVLFFAVDFIDFVKNYLDPFVYALNLPDPDRHSKILLVDNVIWEILRKGFMNFAIQTTHSTGHIS